MKNSFLTLTKLLYIGCFSFFLFSSCDKAGVTSKFLYGDEQDLPEELKGLKVYSVSTGGGTYIKVAILNGDLNSTTYVEGKTTETTIILNKQNGKQIKVSQILVENDSIILCRK